MNAFFEEHVFEEAVFVKNMQYHSAQVASRNCISIWPSLSTAGWCSVAETDSCQLGLHSIHRTSVYTDHWSCDPFDVKDIELDFLHKTLPLGFIFC